jgi:hypothetical protein
MATCPQGAIEFGCCEEDAFMAKRITHQFSVFTAIKSPVGGELPPVAGFFLRARVHMQLQVPGQPAGDFTGVSHINRWGTIIEPSTGIPTQFSCPPHKWREVTGSGYGQLPSGFQFTVDSQTGTHLSGTIREHPANGGAVIGSAEAFLEDEITVAGLDAMLRDQLALSHVPVNQFTTGLGFGCDGSTGVGPISPLVRLWSGFVIACPLGQGVNDFIGVNLMRNVITFYYGLIQIVGQKVTFTSSRYCKARTVLNHPAVACDPTFFSPPVHGPYVSCETVEATDPVTVEMPPLAALGRSVFDDVWATDAPNSLRSFQLQPIPPCCNLLP